MTMHRKLFYLCESDTEELVKAITEQSVTDLESTYYVCYYWQTDSHKYYLMLIFVPLAHKTHSFSFVIVFCIADACNVMQTL